MKKSMIVGLITFIALGLATGYYFLSYAPHQAAVTKFEDVVKDLNEKIKKLKIR